MAYPTINNCVIDIGCLSDLFGDQKATILNFILDALAAIYTDGQADLTDIEAKIDIIDTNVDDIEAMLCDLVFTFNDIAPAGGTFNVVAGTFKKVTIIVQPGDTATIALGGGGSFVIGDASATGQTILSFGNGITMLDAAISITPDPTNTGNVSVVQEGCVVI